MAAMTETHALTGGCAQTGEEVEGDATSRAREPSPYEGPAPRPSSAL